MMDKYRPKIDSDVQSKVLDSGVSSKLSDSGVQSKYGSDRNIEKTIGNESKNVTGGAGGQGLASTVRWTRQNTIEETTCAPKKDNSFFNSTGDGFYKPKNLNSVGSLADLGLRSKIEVLAGTRPSLYGNLSMQRDPTKALAETGKS